MLPSRCYYFATRQSQLSVLRTLPNTFSTSKCEHRKEFMSTSSSPPKQAKKEMATEQPSAAEQERLVELAKRNAAYYCVDTHVRSGHKVGVGTGSTAAFVIECLAERYRSGALTNIVCVPTSMQSRYLLIDTALPMTDLDHEPRLDICIDGCDECDPNLDCIKGGGGALAQEKIVMSCSDRFMVVADHRKRQTRLGARWEYIPLEVLPMAYLPLKRRIEKTEGGVCKLRAAVRKAGPVVSDNGNYVMDWYFDRSVLRSKSDLFALNDRLLRMPGLLETGLFLDCVHSAYFGMPDGSVCELDSESAGRRTASASLTNGNNGCGGDSSCVECSLWGGKTVVAAETQ